MTVSLTYHPRLSIGESIREKKLDKIKKKLESRPLLSGIFLITLSENESDQLDIYEAKLLAQGYYRRNPPVVVGLAGNYDEAVGLVEQLVRECLKARGDCALKEYLLC